MDTGTVRLVIFLGMFLAFAGDYSALISTIFGNAEVQNNKSEIASNRREGSAIEENNPERIVESAWIKSEDESGIHILLIIQYKIEISRCGIFWTQGGGLLLYI